MNNNFNLDVFWVNMAIDAIELAKSKATIEDYKKFCNVQPREAGQSFDDRIRVLDFLIRNKIILHDDKRLAIGTMKHTEWIDKALEKGSEQAWKIATAIDPDQFYLNKFDDEINKKIGLLGEHYVFEEILKALPNHLHLSVKHLSLVNDSWGYDIISPCLYPEEKRVLLEVKTTSRPFGEFRFFLSMNEFRVSQQKKNWYIVLVRIVNGKPTLEGNIVSSKMANIMPDNINNRVEWQSVKIKVDQDWVVRGLPI